jgi:hypothetical protein
LLERGLHLSPLLPRKALEIIRVDLQNQEDLVLNLLDHLLHPS